MCIRFRHQTDLIKNYKQLMLFIHILPISIRRYIMTDKEICSKVVDAVSYGWVLGVLITLLVMHITFDIFTMIEFRLMIVSIGISSFIISITIAVMFEIKNKTLLSAILFSMKCNGLFIGLSYVLLTIIDAAFFANI